MVLSAFLATIITDIGKFSTRAVSSGWTLLNITFDKLSGLSQ